MSESLKHTLEVRQAKLRRIRILQVVSGLLLGVLLASFVVVGQMNKDKSRMGEMHREAAQTTTEKTVPPNNKNIGGPFALINQDGKPTTDADFKGKYLLVYFGYTYCPDMCPTGLSSIAHAMDQLKTDADKVQPLYITVDPARDTPEKLKQYDASFHPKIVGLTGTPEQIAKVAKEYDVYYAKGEQVDDKDYVMDHTSLIYLMDPQGKFITTFDEEVDPAAIVKALHEQWAKPQPAP